MRDDSHDPPAATRPPTYDIKTIKKELSPNFPWYFIGLAVVILLCFQQVGFSLTELIRGLPDMAGFIVHALPPDFTRLDQFLLSILQTVEISVAGTFLAILLAIPVGIGASSNFSPHPVIYWACRTLLNFTRSVSEMIVALIFVTAVGLGPFSGVMALAIHSAGMLGKFYAEAIENVGTGEIEAIKATGATTGQVLRFAVWPQVLPELTTVILYRWEVNIRSATVLGMVGAGGIGFDLITSIRLFQYQETSAIIFLTLLTVAIIDQINSRIRAKII
ncbi:MAG TPA: phosphonate ABC transporter, permease protein PhnE [Methylomusa anaerophila]|uniref:Phosphate-import permease protein PhnE n=1 Tax=Methylomusa anaerophila TaxID=1930071 RepID=A0A348AGR8_9FIRM|nr:phosphonate ABC transporter, permease protein PhnE [Methylomusa anaerophila]BBB90266.1 phosphate-import permease protein PhnE [Methylomusa anaerophila]HML89388.1 phosphonate ABC transporter, permease protein PhnE [Methylomusa anaerophila]